MDKVELTLFFGGLSFLIVFLIQFLKKKSS